MMFTLLLQRLMGRQTEASPRIYSNVLRLEQLGSRILPATYYVLGLGDTPGPVTSVSPGVFHAPTLRAAIDAANATPVADLINFRVGGTIVMNRNDTSKPTAFGPTGYVITTPITIAGNPRGSAITLDGNGSRRLFGITPTGSLQLEFLTLVGGLAQGGNGGNGAGTDGGGGGGGAGLGGALFNQGTVRIINSTLHNHTAQGGAGGNAAENLAGDDEGGGGGGGLGGNGGSAGRNGSNDDAGGGGGGTGGNGGSVNSEAVGGGGGGGTLTNGGNGGAQAGSGGTANGGAGGGNSAAGAAGGNGGGGGGGGKLGVGGNGGFGGGGGGGGDDRVGGLGGFGGGGGGGDGLGGDGGFGGGGGGAGQGSNNPGGFSAFGGGAGGEAGENGEGGGGGGLGGGGAIFNDQGASLIVVNSTITANTAAGGLGGNGFGVGSNGGAGEGLGGGIFNRNGTVTIRNSTVAGNSTRSNGEPAQAGALFNLGISEVSPSFSIQRISQATTTLINSILANSDANEDVMNQSVNQAIASIVAGMPNLLQTPITNKGGTVNNSGVITADPRLGLLAQNGGPTRTMMPDAGSPAINAGNNAAAAGLIGDQRDYRPRIVGGRVDLGAVEVGALPPPSPVQNVSSLVRVLYPRLYSPLGNGQFQGVFTLVNVSSKPITGPIKLTFPHLPPGVSVVSATTLPSLRPGQGGLVRVIFRNPLRQYLGLLQLPQFAPVVLGQTAPAAGLIGTRA
ncbi:MAG: choice-of-anchor Q domain-containing protein [Gemmataceae bacterium]